MTTVILIITILSAFLQTLSLRKIQTKTLRDNVLVNGLFCGIIGIALIVYALGIGDPISPVTLLLGALFGAMFVATVSVYYYAMQSGPLSYTAFFFSASMLIPAVAGILFWREIPTVGIVIALVLFLAAFYLISVLGGTKGKKGNTRWLILSLLTFLFNGLLAVCSKIQQTLLQGTQVVSFTAASFTFALVWGLIFYLILLAKSKDGKALLQADAKAVKASLFPLLGAAIGTGLLNFLLNYLVYEIPSAYLYPLVQGSLMVLTTSFSLFVLKEKLNKWGILGILTGIAAIIVINL